RCHLSLLSRDRGPGAGKGRNRPICWSEPINQARAVAFFAAALISYSRRSRGGWRMKIAPIGILCGRVRLEEKVIFEAFRARSTSFDRLDEDSLGLPIGKPWTGTGVVLVRSIDDGRPPDALSVPTAVGAD